MPHLNGILVDHLLEPLQNMPYRTAWVIDCLNYATMYPKFFRHVDNHHDVFYIFVTRGDFMKVPDKTRGGRRRRFRTTCPGVSRVLHNNVMVISCCSSYMYSIKLDNTSKCSFSCSVAEGLFNVWSNSSGNGRLGLSRFPTQPLERLNSKSEDQCQIDDFVIGVVACVLAHSGRNVELFSKDSRFFGANLRLPFTEYPFYMIVQTRHDRVGIPVYQKDAAELYRMADGTPNPNYEAPRHIEGAPVHLSLWNTKRKCEERLQRFRNSRATRPGLTGHTQEIDVSRPGLEDPVENLSESSFEDPITPEAYDDLKREGLYEEDPDCGYVIHEPKMSYSSVDRLRNLASFSDILQARTEPLDTRSRHRPQPLP